MSDNRILILSRTEVRMGFPSLKDYLPQDETLDSLLNKLEEGEQVIAGGVSLILATPIGSAR